MAVEVAGYRSRKRNEQAKHAAKAKKEKILLAVCGVVLLALLGFQGPKMLKTLHGSNAAAPAAVAPSTSSAPATGTQVASAAEQADDLRAAKRFASKDPFVAQLGTAAVAQPEVEVAAPAVRESHFVKKDPFVQQLSFATTAPSSPTPTAPKDAPPPTGKKAGRGKAAAGSGDYIVMVASIPVADGRGAARAAAATARSHGVPSVKIVTSSSYPTLRTGFYAVYSGPYPTLADLLPALEQVRGKGYPSAYTRRLAH
jgi:hypothetical protein